MTDDASPPPPQWSVVLPLKGGSAAKSRLRGGPVLAHAIALDCLAAVLACPDVRRVYVVTADAATAASAGSLGAEVVTERRPGSGLSAAVRDGVAATSGGPVAVLLGDLPALSPSALSAGLRAAAGALGAEALMAAVPDAEGSGTVLLAARSAADLRPAFGPGSLAAHRRRGALVVRPDLPPDDDARLRRDVDTPADLLVALALGVGPRTAAVLAAARTAS